MIRRSSPKKYAGKFGHFCVTEEDTKPNMLMKGSTNETESRPMRTTGKRKEFLFSVMHTAKLESFRRKISLLHLELDT